MPPKAFLKELPWWGEIINSENFVLNNTWDDSEVILLTAAML